jgi:hypothetical protein
MAIVSRTEIDQAILVFYFSSGTLDAINNVLGLLRMVNPGAFEDGLLPEEGDLLGEEGENPEGTGLDIEGEVVAEVDPLEQIRSDMALLKSHIADLPSQDVINKLQAQVAMLPGKDEIVSAVLGKIPKPTCSCQQSIGADNPDLGLGDPRRDGNVE